MSAPIAADVTGSLRRMLQVLVISDAVQNFIWNRLRLLKMDCLYEGYLSRVSNCYRFSLFDGFLLQLIGLLCLKSIKELKMKVLVAYLLTK